jgi:hypothetical protein
MKKLITLLLFVSLTFALSAQELSLGKPIPKDYFSQVNKVNLSQGVTLTNSFIAPRFQVGVNGVSYGKDKASGKIVPYPLSSVGFGLGFLHYKNADGVPFNDYGFTALLLYGTQESSMGIGLYGSYNFGLANNLAPIILGAHYDFVLKQVFVDTGVTIHF